MADENEEFEFRLRHEREKAKTPDPVMRAINKSPTAGLVDAGLSLGSGAVAGPISGLSGLLGTALPGPEGQGADWAQRTQDALTIEPSTTIGKGITNAVSYPFMKLSELADYAGGKTAERTKSPLAGTGVNMALQSVPLVLGRVAPVGEGAASLSKRNALRTANASTDEALVNAREAGYKTPPTQSNPSLLNKVVEGAGGKIKTAQDLSIENQPLTNDLVRKGLGLPEGTPLNAATLREVRSEAGKAYERIRGAGRVTADDVFSKNLDAIAEPYVRAAKDFPEGARTDIIDAVKAARRESFDAGSAIDQIGIFRDKADTAFAGKDKRLGRAYRGIADAMEDQLGRHLEETGASATALDEFRNARRSIAQTYTVEKHLQNSGNVDTAGLARELKKGKPLTGEIRTAAEFGQNFPKAAQLPEKVAGVPMSPLDYGVSLASLAGAVATGQPLVALGAAAPFARPAIRSALKSDWYQNNFAGPREYGPSALTRARMRFAESQKPPLIPLSEIAEGQRQ